MNRIQELIKTLHLQPHPEGGFYAETYRSEGAVETANGSRSLCTSIYFLLTAENISKFHRIQSDELWFFHEGSPLTVHLLDDSGYQTLKLGAVSEEGHQPYQKVSAGVVFGSTVEEGYALVSCVVAPGFDFADFKLFTAEELLMQFPDYPDIIKKLA